jgi:hypothetical protein
MFSHPPIISDRGVIATQSPRGEGKIFPDSGERKLRLHKHFKDSILSLDGRGQR